MSKEMETLDRIIDAIEANNDTCAECVLRDIVRIVALYVASKDVCHGYNIED